MTFSLVGASLRYYRRTHAAVILGVGTAVAVLTGALLVGDSVRTSLRDLVLERLGRADIVLTAPRYVREGLVEDILNEESFGRTFAAVAPLIASQGVVTHEASGRRGGAIRVFGVDARFWAFHGQTDPQLEGRQLLLSESLAEELGASEGETLLVRVRRSSSVPGSSLFGRRSDLGRTLRLRAAGVLTPGQLGEFSLHAHQQAVRAIFVPLATLQRTLGQRGLINTLLFDAREDGTAGDSLARAAAVVRRVYRLEDLGLRVRVLEERGSLSLESDSAMLDDATIASAEAASAATALKTRDVLTYLATSIRSGEREIPYSLVTAFGEEALAELSGIRGDDATREASSIILNRWAADDLGVEKGAPIELEYLLWEEEGRLRTESASFTLADVVPLEGAAADRDLAPEYPGITETQSLSDWDPPFPVDLQRVRERDEDYWDDYGATPKAFIVLARGQELWRHRLGRLTSLRLVPTHDTELQAARIAFMEELRGQIDPFASGLSLEAVRARGLAASQGATDFGEYFGYFSFFLIAAALLLAALFFRLGAEQRLAELGLLRAVGFSTARVRALFLREGGVLAALGSGLGVLGAWGYAALMMWGLRTVWVDAVGTGRLQLHISPITLALGGVGGLLSALACIAWSLRSLLRIEPRRLLAGSIGEPLGPSASRRARFTIAGALLLAVALLIATAAGAIPAVGGFFGAGGALMLAALVSQWRTLAARATSSVRTVAELGFRSAGHRPGRSLLCIALIAFATFVIVSVGAFRHDGAATSLAHDSSSGGYTLFAESLLPIHHDPNTPAGREALGLDSLDAELFDSVHLTPFRVRPGDDASCLNLYRPQDPRILAPRSDFLASRRFAFGSTIAATPDEKMNPWRLLDRELEDGVIPVIGDQNSLAYVLHVGLGDEFALERAEGAPLRLRVVGALRTGLFQGELLMSEQHFLDAFPDLGGFRFFLIEGPSDQAPEIAAQLERRLEDYGFDVRTTASRLAEFHRVENTYLATFQTLGALGLLLGTVGLATVLLRNALERRRELALLRALGYRRAHMALMVLAENVLLLARGLATGAVCALVAIAPVAFERGASFPYTSLGLLLLAVLATGVFVSWIATVAISREPLLPALRSE